MNGTGCRPSAAHRRPCATAHSAASVLATVLDIVVRRKSSYAWLVFLIQLAGCSFADIRATRNAGFSLALMNNPPCKNCLA